MTGISWEAAKFCDPLHELTDEGMHDGVKNTHKSRRKGEDVVFREKSSGAEPTTATACHVAKLATDT